MFLRKEGQVRRSPLPDSRVIPVPEGNPLPPLHGKQQVRVLQEDLKPQVRQGNQPAQPHKGSLHQQELHGSRPEQLPKEGSHRQVLQGSLHPHSRLARAEDQNRTSLRVCNALHRGRLAAVRAAARAVAADRLEIQGVQKDQQAQALLVAPTEGNGDIRKTIERDANSHLFFMLAGQINISGKEFWCIFISKKLFIIKSDKMNRRNFIRNSAMSAAAFSLMSSQALGNTGKDVPKNLLPRWRGFNLLDYFSPYPEGKMKRTGPRKMICGGWPTGDLIL